MELHRQVFGQKMFLLLFDFFAAAKNYNIWFCACRFAKYPKGKFHIVVCSVGCHPAEDTFLAA